MKRKHALPAGSAATPAVTTYKALERIRMSWPIHFMKAFPEAIAVAEDEWSSAVLGRSPVTDEDFSLLAKERTSLPVMWASFFRDLGAGRTGTDRALEWPPLGAAVLRAGLQRIAQARGVYVECLQLLAAQRSAVMRDLFNGEIYLLTDLEEPLLSRILRWMRFCGVLVDLGSGSWNFISSFASVSADPVLAPSEFIDLARAALSQVGVSPDEIDPVAPHSGLRRYCGIAFPAVYRSLRERPKPEPPRIFAINSDGERLELAEATVTLSPMARARLAQALPSAEDFVQTGDEHWCWISRQHTKSHAQGENLGDVEGAGPRFSASANSPQRLARLLARLAALCGERPVVESSTTMRPWEKADGVVPAAEDGVKTVTISTGAPMFDMDFRTAQQSMPLFYMQHMHRLLDQHIEDLGGAPRSLVRSTEGQAVVERWLVLVEAKGRPAQDGRHLYVDLDPLREELGLRTVADQIARGAASRHLAPGR